MSTHRFNGEIGKIISQFSSNEPHHRKTNIAMLVIPFVNSIMANKPAHQCLPCSHLSRIVRRPVFSQQGSFMKCGSGHSRVIPRSRLLSSAGHGSFKKTKSTMILATLFENQQCNVCTQKRLFSLGIFPV